MTAVAFTGNTAGDAGGAIASRGGATLRVTGSTFADNRSTGNNGGAIDSAFSGVHLIVTNSTFSGNTAPMGDGGAINNYQGTATLTNVTLVNNGPHDAVASWTDSGIAATTSLTNVLVANNGSGGDLSAIGGGTFTGSHNLIDDGSGGLIAGGAGDITGRRALIGTLANYGGATQTLPLLPGSPAIDAGASIGEGVPAQDQRGVTRVGAPDIGAFESRGFTLGVTGGSPQSAIVNQSFLTPLAVSLAANGPGEPVDGGVVTFAPPASGASSTLSGATMTISGGAASVTATANGTKGAYTVTASANGAPGVTFSLTNTAPLVSITVTPTTPTLKVGQATPFTATGTYADGATQDLTHQITWGSDTPGVASVDANGTVTAKTGGTATIAARSGDLQGATAVTVTTPIFTGVQPAPAPASRPGAASTPATGPATVRPAPLPGGR